MTRAPVSLNEIGDVVQALAAAHRAAAALDAGTIPAAVFGKAVSASTFTPDGEEQFVSMTPVNGASVAAGDRVLTLQFGTADFYLLGKVG